MYIHHELESLELEQAQIDADASRLEKNIREVMSSSELKNIIQNLQACCR